MKTGKRFILEIDLAAIALLIAVSIFIYSCIILPVIENRSLISVREAALAEQKAKVAQLDYLIQNLTDEHETIRQELLESKVQLEASEKVNGRIAQLTSIFSNCDLDVDDVRIDKIVATERCNVVPIIIAGRGGYNQCATFLQELSKQFPDTGIARFDLSGSPSRPQEPQRFVFELLWSTTPEELTN